MGVQYYGCVCMLHATHEVFITFDVRTYYGWIETKPTGQFQASESFYAVSEWTSYGHPYEYEGVILAQGRRENEAIEMLHNGLLWNEAMDNQNMDRIHRIGQKRKVSITRIIRHERFYWTLVKMLSKDL